MLIFGQRVFRTKGHHQGLRTVTWLSCVRERAKRLQWLESLERRGRLVDEVKGRGQIIQVWPA